MIFFYKTSKSKNKKRKKKIFLSLFWKGKGGGGGVINWTDRHTGPNQFAPSTSSKLGHNNE